MNVSVDIWLPLNSTMEETSSHYMSLTIDPRMKPYFHSTAVRLWNWMVPRMTDPPFVPSSEVTLITVSQNVTRTGGHHSNLYNVITWILVVVIVLIVLIYLITFIVYRRKLRTYQVLKRVEELNFT